MKVIDLFCGAGGFSEGFERAGFEVVRAYDIWAPAILTHNQNHGFGKEIAFRGDIYEISMMDDDKFEEYIPDTEVIIGSPPCIAFSNSNRSGKADKTIGIKLIEAFLRIVARKLNKPNSKLKYWVMENVVNSQRYVKKSYNSSDLEWPQLGDFILEVPQNKVFNMKYYGVPTNRRRFICGNYPDLYDLNDDNGILTLGQIMSALGKPNPKNYLNDINKVVDPIYGIEVASSELTDHHYIKEIPYFEWSKALRQKRDKGYMGRMAFPENKSNPARTIMATLSGASRESMIYKLEGEEKRYRYPTIREVATLMSFPIDFRFYGESDSVKYRMIGNAVAPKFSYEIAQVIKKDAGKSNIKDKFSYKKKFKNDVPFVGLNGTKFDLKKEKPKRTNARYSYHVPYLKINAFRVGLQNHQVDGRINWSTKIHYSQGKNAKVFKNIPVDLSLFAKEEALNINEFTNKYTKIIGTFESLQEEYCKTIEERNTGPDELLKAVREFIDKNQQLDRQVYIKEISREVSMKIITSYYILETILKGIE